MDDFEKVAFAGLEKDQHNILWVRHSHAGHHELHFVIPRVELISGKAFNPCPPGWQKYFDVFRDLHNHKEKWARPDDPERARFNTPEHADIHKARLIRWGQNTDANTSTNTRTEVKEAIHIYLKERLQQGMLTNRADVLTALQEIDFKINRVGKDYISIKDPESGEKFRLKGGIYAESWELSKFTELTDRTHQNQDRAGQTNYRKVDQRAIQCLTSEFNIIIKKRSAYNRNRYPAPAYNFGAERKLTLQNSEQNSNLEMPAKPFARSLPYYRDKLGDRWSNSLSREKNYQSEQPNQRTYSLQTNDRTDSHSTTEQNLGADIDGNRTRQICNPARENNAQHRLDYRQETSHKAGVNNELAENSIITKIGVNYERNRNIIDTKSETVAEEPRTDHQNPKYPHREIGTGITKTAHDPRDHANTNERIRKLIIGFRTALTTLEHSLKKRLRLGKKRIMAR